MRTFSVKKYVTNGRPGLVISDEDNNRHRLVTAPSFPMAKRLVGVAIQQQLAREESPMPKCDKCLGGLLPAEQDFSICQNPECRDWYEKAQTICDRVEVCIKSDEEVGVIEL